jgi:hypothetical protein
MIRSRRLSDQIAGVGRHPMRIAAFPLHVAANGIRDRRADRFAGEMLFQRALEIVRFRAVWLARVIDSASGVDEPPVAIENKKVRGAERAVRARDVLGGVVKIKPREFLCAHPLHHVREIILGVGVRAVRIDRDKADSARRELLHRPPRGFIRTGHVRAVIAGEENYEDRIAGEIIERIRFSIRRRETKIRRALADLQGKAHAIS